MRNNEILEIGNIFSKAVRIAQAQNSYELTREISETIAIELLKQAFPQNKNLINSAAIVKNILSAKKA